MDKDTQWIPTDGEELARLCHELLKTYERITRRENAWDYILRCEQRNGRKIWRLFQGSLAFFLLAVVMALLVG